ncbi:MAG TPA: hypothetical protein VKB75_12765 [Jatrophihabitans sp.]|nr:hypothetical protein [Jatrophihabitans sp.]
MSAAAAVAFRIMLREVGWAARRATRSRGRPGGGGCAPDHVARGGLGRSPRNKIAGRVSRNKIAGVSAAAAVAFRIMLREVGWEARLATRSGG